MKYLKPCAVLLLCLLLTLSAGLTACTPEAPAADTTDSATNAATDPSPETPTEAPTDADTDAETEADTQPPADMSADEVKTLLAAVLASEIEGGTVTTRSLMDGVLLTETKMAENGDDFLILVTGEGMAQQTVAVGDHVYYYVSIDDGTSKTELRYVMTPTAEERAEIYALSMGEDTSADLTDTEMTEGLLNGTLTGKKHSDGTVEITCTDLPASLIALIMGDGMEGATLSFAFTVNAESRMTYMGFTVTVPGELTGGEAVTVSSETLVDYAVPTITAPEDASAYAEATYDELFGYQLPEIDPEEAAAMGLPLDGDNYVIGGENPTADPAQQLAFLYVYAPYYADKTFTVSGIANEDNGGNILITLGEDMALPAYFGSGSEPVAGAYVQVTGTLTQTVDMGDYVDFDCFTLMATSYETLGEAKGPNGGKLMFITASSLNVRSTPDSSVGDNKVGLLYSGDMVEVMETGLGSNSNWCKIIFDCDAGYAYISMTYVSETKP